MKSILIKVIEFIAKTICALWAIVFIGLIFDVVSRV